MTEKKGFFSRLVKGLSKTRSQVVDSMNQVFKSFTQIDDDLYDELEEILIMADLGVRTTTDLIERLRQKVTEQKIKDPLAVKELLMSELRSMLKEQPTAYDFLNQPTVMLVIGVNGVGKTTTIGKLAYKYKAEGKKVLLAAGDTFRAAAIEQLREWSNRSNVPLIAQAENADPSAVIYDAIASAKAKGIDLLICDTAGRLHNKKNLMIELEKMFRVIGREYPEAHIEVLLVLDSTTGQNALEQARQFNQMTDITGLVLTKLDGTAKGGIAIAISSELQLPIKYIGVGEKTEDLSEFQADQFIDALFAE